jgi:hypothetical protein
MKELKKKILCGYVPIWLILWLIMASCGSRTVVDQQNQLPEVDRIEILFFQSPQRCVICDNIETRTKELLDSLYSNEIAKGDMVYKIIEISKKENENIVDKYEAAWTSLFINRWKDGKETSVNMTEYAISYSMRKSADFKEGLKNKIEEIKNML